VVFRIRRIFDDLSPANEKAIARIREILKEQFPGVRPEEGESIPEKLRNQLKYGFQTILFAAEKGLGNVHGFALALHDLILKFCYPDYVAVTGRDAGGGLGGSSTKGSARRPGTWAVSAFSSNACPTIPPSAGMSR